jgi:hypothetical protein
MSWADELLIAAHDHRLALIRQFIAQTQKGTISDTLKRAISANDDFIAALEAARKEEASGGRIELKHDLDGSA